MNLIRSIKLSLGLMNFTYSIDRWVLTRDLNSPGSNYFFYHSRGSVTPNKHWPYLWKCTRLFYLERTLFGLKHYITKETPVLLEAYKEKD